MAIQDYKITSSDLANKGVVGLPDTPNLSTLVMQQKFDEIAKDVIVPKHNELIEFLGESLAPIVSENPVDGETFIYNSTDGTYKNGEYRTTLKRLKDVDITNIQNGDFLNYDGNRDLIVPIHSSGTVETITSCEDVSVLNPKEGDFFVMGANNAWENREIHIGLPPRLIITSETGAVFTATKDTTIIDLTEKGTTGVFTCDLNDYGTWVVTGVKNGETVSVSISVDTSKEYTQTLTFFAATITVTYPDNATVTCSDGTTTLTATASPYDFIVHNSGTWTITGTRSSVTETQTVSITTNGQTESVTLTIVPDGDTATPTADIQTLLECADIWDKTTYTTISDLLDDDASLLKVLTTDNAIDYLVRSTTWTTAITGDSDAMSMIGSYDYASDTLLADSTWGTAIANSSYVRSVENIGTPTMTSANTPSGECSSKTIASASYPAWKAFDKDTSSIWASATNPSDDYLRYKFNKAVKVDFVKIKAMYSGSLRLKTLSIKASNDNFSTSETLMATTTLVNQNVEDYLYPVSPSTKFDSFGIENLTTYQSDVEIKELDFLGRENGGVQSWLKSANIDKPYTTLAEVLADYTTLAALIASQDAVDYLVTAKGLIDGIVADATAMSYIGLNNYCANTLLADADWAEAIGKSTYKESVENAKVPAMTGATTPSGEAFSSSNYSGYDAWKAFDGNYNATGWIPNTTDTFGSAYVAYYFNGASVKLASVELYLYYNSVTTYNIVVKVQGSNDGNTWTDIAANLSVEKTNNIYKYYFPALNGYKYGRVVLMSGSNVTAGSGWHIQFYGREDV